MVLQKSLEQIHKLLTHGAPPLVAIVIFEVLDIEIFVHSPVGTNDSLLLLWSILKMIPCFIFSIISDKHLRKITLITCQLLGLTSGFILLHYGLKTWIILLIAITFNPLPIARASFLDSFHRKYSTLKLLAITFLAQFGPLVFHSYFSDIPYEKIIYWSLWALAINIFLTFLYKDKYDTDKEDISLKITSSISTQKKMALISSLGAFTFAETTFYFLWAYLQYSSNFQSQLSITTMGTIVGVCIAMLYTRLPHISAITFFYNIGAGTTLIALFRCFANPSFCAESLVNSMTYYTLIGGLYLPFVSDSVIDMISARHKAFGLATIELGGVIARALAALISVIVNQHTFFALSIITLLYILASTFQRFSEEKHKYIH